MENQVVNQNQELPQVREISVITDEIISLKAQANNMMLMYAIEVGRRLVEAKAMLQHGEWGAWLKDKVEFSKSTANNLMNIYEEYGNSNFQALGNLNYTKAVMLLAVPEEEREEFVQENKVDEMTSRELEKVIRERDEALKKVQANADLEARIKELKKTLAEAEERAREADKKAQTMAGKAMSAERKLEEKLNEIEVMKENPNIPQDLIDNLKTEAAEASRKAFDDELKKNAEAVENAKKAKKAAEEDAKTLKAKIEALEKQVKMSNSDLMEFKILFDAVQKDVSRLIDIKAKFKGVDDKMHVDLTKALVAFFDKSLGRC